MGRLKALFLASALALTGTVVGVVPGTAPVPVAAAVDPTPTVDPFDRGSVWSSYQSSLVEAKGVPVGWTGSTSTCTEGTETAASIEATQAAINFYRGLAGLPNLASAGAAANADAMRAALLQDANRDRGLSHTPSNDWACWTQARRTASETHNLASLPAAQGVELYMVDPGDGNDFAGHRNWILNPRGTTFATGSTSRYNALDVNTAGSVPAGVDWVAWPNEGFVPKAIVQPYVWWTKTLFSIKNAAQAYDWSAATPSVKVGSTVLPIEIRDRVGQLTWYTTLPSDWSTSGEVKLDITISGLRTTGGAAVPAHSYSSTAIVSGGGTPATAPGALTGVTATAGNGQATVSWTAPASDGGSPITGYRITPYTGTTPLATRTTGTATTTTITGLTNGTPHTFRVQAVNAIGTSTQSAASAAVTPTAPATAPGAPTGVTATAGNGQATVSWTPPATNGGSPITGYRITPYTGTTPLATRTTGTATTTTITGLTNGTPHTFRVQAVNAIGTSTRSAASAPVTPTAPATPPYAPYASWSQLVDQVFRQMVGRAPTATERDRWIGPLTSRTETPGDLVATLRGSSHHRDVVDPVTRLYRAYLQRIPDRGGLEYWIAQRLGGRSLRSISAFFARSNEFTTKYGALSDRAFVLRIYEDVLERPAEAGGVAYWTDQIATGKRGRGEVMIGFSESAEYKRKQASEVTVSVLHILWLDRAPTAQEHTDGVTALDGGTGVSDYADSLLPRAAVLP